MANQTPSKRIKRLYNNRPTNDPTSLKDFAVDLGANGSQDEKHLVNSWLTNKSRSNAGE